MRRFDDRTGEPLAARLSTRRGDLEDELWNRIRAIREPSSPTEEAYVAELGATVRVGLDYGLDAIARGPAGRRAPIPDQLLLQARHAARAGISLDAILRRYCAGNSLLTDTLISEAGQLSLPRDELKLAFRSLAVTFEHLLFAVSEEYSREASKVAGTGEERRLELVERLLAGELVEASELGYNFSAWHRGIVAFGADAPRTVRTFAQEANASLLLIRRRDGVVWGWLGARHRHVLAERSQPPPTSSASAALALGEPGQGLPGWRLTHRQAVAALPLALKTAHSASYAQAPLLATALKDDLLATSLYQLYIDPLSQERDGGDAAKSTLRAYYEAARNASSAAAALGVDRRTVTARIASIEDRLGLRLDACSAEIEIALRLDAIENRSRSNLTPGSSTRCSS
jgi:hypothetical protein